ncbi:amidohydrolase [Pigmentiphaga litoralis]|uniref:amidohydrolase n=1 Tax=Pigmentiphaga litoralis TaxID=516702 RepID=UPI003B42FA18
MLSSIGETMNYAVVFRRVATLATTGLLLAQPAFADERKDEAFRIIDRNADTVAQIGDAIYSYAELGMQEVKSTQLLKDTLEAAGFSVEMGGAGMPTNLWAKWGSGKPVIAISTEIDALPEGSQTPGSIPRKPVVPGAPGHMEGHNTHGGVATAAAFAVKKIMERDKLPGTLIISFGPAEEQLISRPFLVRAGYFKDVDAAFILHIGDNLSTGYGLQNYAAISAKFTFHGKTAHGANNPWDGRDAVDAVELMDIGFDKLREHMRPTYRAHRTITMGGIQPNIIADVGQIWWYVRDANAPAAKENFDRLVNVGKGAAMMTGTTMDPPEFVASAWPQLGNKVLSEQIRKNMEMVGLPTWTAEEVAFAKELQKANNKPEVGLATALPTVAARPQGTASNDNGDVTWVVPTGMMNFPASVPGIGYHAWPAAITPTSTMAHKGMVTGAKVLAASLLDAMTSPALLQNARKEFADATKDSPYFSLLPADAKPPVDMNRATMDQFGPALSKTYLSVSPRFR